MLQIQRFSQILAKVPNKISECNCMLFCIDVHNTNPFLWWQASQVIRHKLGLGSLKYRWYNSVIFLWISKILNRLPSWIIGCITKPRNIIYCIQHWSPKWFSPLFWTIANFDKMLEERNQMIQNKTWSNEVPKLIHTTLHDDVYKEGGQDETQLHVWW